MHKRITVVFVFFLVIMLVLSACQAGAPSKADCSKTEVLCVGLVTGLGGIRDNSINQAAWEGVKQAQNDKSATQVRDIETVDSKDFLNNITTLAQAGYDVIVTVGSVQAEATVSAAKNFPQTLFIGVNQGQGETLPNLVGLVFHEDQSGYLAGALAAQITKSGVIAGVFDSVLVPTMSAYKHGFEAGAKSINPGINIVTTFYPGSAGQAASDPTWGASAAAQSIQDGADVVFAPGNSTGKGALVETASHPGFYCIGATTDQWEILPAARSCLVTSAIDRISQGVHDLIKSAKAGSFPSGNYYGNTDLAPFHDFSSLIPKPVQDKMSQVVSGLKDGSITTGYNPDK